jgi:hypothetical protein
VANGEVRQVTRDIDIGGATAFTRGEQVTIERVEPNPERPEYKHVVFSRPWTQRSLIRRATLSSRE